MTTTGIRSAGGGGGSEPTVTESVVGLVIASKTAERFCDWATSAAMSSASASASIWKLTRMLLNPLLHLGVAAEDAEDVHVALDRGLDRLELDAPVLRHGRDARGEAAREAHEHELDGRRPLVLGGEDERMVGLVAEGRLVVVIGAEPAVLLGSWGLAVRATQPLVRRRAK